MRNEDPLRDEKRADTADISVLFFLWLYTIKLAKDTVLKAIC